MMDIIYCAGDNPQLMRIALEEGFSLGIRSDRLEIPGQAVMFVDIHYKEPDFTAHLETVKRLRPRYAIVPDLSVDQMDLVDVKRAIDQAEQLAPHCLVPLVVPKFTGQIAHIPQDMAIAYSLKSSYGAARFEWWELAGRRVHLLGGSPQEQMKIYRYLSNVAEVISVDCNMHQRVCWNAVYWSGNWKHHPEKQSQRPGLSYECFRLSCQNILQAWAKLIG